MVIKCTPRAIGYLSLLDDSWKKVSFSFDLILQNIVLDPSVTGSSIYIIAIEDISKGTSRARLENAVRTKNENNLVIVVHNAKLKPKTFIEGVSYAAGKTGEEVKRIISDFRVGKEITVDVGKIEDAEDIIKGLYEESPEEQQQQEEDQIAEQEKVDLKIDLDYTESDDKAQEKAFRSLSERISKTNNLTDIKSLIEMLNELKQSNQYLDEINTVNDLELLIRSYQDQISQIMRNDGIPLEQRLDQVRLVVNQRNDTVIKKDSIVVSAFCKSIDDIVEKAVEFLERDVKNYNERILQASMNLDTANQYAVFQSEADKYNEIKSRLLDTEVILNGIANDIDSLGRDMHSDVHDSFVSPTGNIILDNQLGGLTTSSEILNILARITNMLTDNFAKLSDKLEDVESIKKVLDEAFKMSASRMENYNKVVRYLEVNNVEDVVRTVDYVKSRMNTYVGYKGAGVSFVASQAAYVKQTDTGVRSLLFDFTGNGMCKRYLPKATVISIEDFVSSTDLEVDLLIVEGRPLDFDSFFEDIASRVKAYSHVTMACYMDDEFLDEIIQKSLSTTLVVNSTKLNEIQDVEMNLARLKSINTASKLLFNFTDNAKEMFELSKITPDLSLKLLRMPFISNIAVQLDKGLISSNNSLIREIVRGY